MEEIFEDNIEAESRIIRMIFRIIKPKFGQNGLILHIVISYTVGKIF